MKHLIRKPMLPVLLLALLVFGTAFLGIFHVQIAKGKEQVERLYNDTRITMELIPGAGWGQLDIKAHKTMIIEAMPEISETLTVMECWYTLEDWATSGKIPEEDFPWVGVNTAILHGTNNISWLQEYWQLEIAWAQGLGAGDFLVSQDVIPCLVKEYFLQEQQLSCGDVFVIYPCPEYGYVMTDAPALTMQVVGTYSDSGEKTYSESLIIPQEAFLGQEVRLLYNSYMMTQSYYRTFALKIYPEYNREYLRIEKELSDILYDAGSFTFVSPARAMENAARPLEERLKMQEFMILPLSVLLSVAAAVSAVLLGLSFGNEVFLRLMWGERRIGVFFRLMGSVVLLLMLCVAAACAAVLLTAGRQWLLWAVEYAGLTAAVCAAGAAVPLVRSCGANLVKLYQAKEVE